MKFYLIAGVVNGGLLVGSLAWLWLDGLYILPVITLIASSVSFGILLGAVDE
jgi:hypothetical protein